MTLLVTAATGTLHRGTVLMGAGDGPWDFSDSTNSVDGDIDYGVLFENGLKVHTTTSAANLTDILVAFTPAGLSLSDSTYEQLIVAPTDPASYVTMLAIFAGDVLAVRTREKHYAKIRIIESQGALWFEYTYQDDGSPVLIDDPVPARPTTWGRVKALYR